MKSRQSKREVVQAAVEEDLGIEVCEATGAAHAAGHWIGRNPHNPDQIGGKIADEFRKEVGERRSSSESFADIAQRSEALRKLAKAKADELNAAAARAKIEKAVLKDAGKAKPARAKPAAEPAAPASRRTSKRDHEVRIRAEAKAWRDLIAALAGGAV